MNFELCFLKHEDHKGITKCTKNYLEYLSGKVKTFNR